MQCSKFKHSNTVHNKSSVTILIPVRANLLYPFQCETPCIFSDWLTLQLFKPFSMEFDNIYLLSEPNFRKCFLIPLRPWVSPPNSLVWERRSPIHTVPPTRLLGQPKEAKVWPSTTSLVTALLAPKNGQL